MIRIKVYKLSQVIGAAVIALLVIAAIVMGIWLFAGGNAGHVVNTVEASMQIDASAAVDKF